MVQMDHAEMHENKHVDTRGAGESGTNWEIGIDMYTLPCVK